MKRFIATLAICILIFLSLQRLLVPKYMESATEGAFVAEYYAEEKNHDVLFFGDCELYENISPAALWRDYGVHSFIRGTPQQTMWQSYYLMEETLTYEKPQIVVCSVFAMQYDKPQNEAYNRMTLDNMKWSRSKIASIEASKTTGEKTIEYVFPLLRFHDRWRALERQDFRYYLQKKSVTHNGYYLRTDVRALSTLPTPLPLTERSFGDNAYAYLDRIADLCEANDIALVLVKAPVLYPYWYDEWDNQIASYANARGLRYVNLLDYVDEIGLDYTTDTYDGGLHLNVFGAEKVAKWFGAYLQTECGAPDRRGDAQYEAIWDAKLERYDAAKSQ